MGLSEWIALMALVLLIGGWLYGSISLVRTSSAGKVILGMVSLIVGPLVLLFFALLVCWVEAREKRLQRYDQVGGEVPQWLPPTAQEVTVHGRGDYIRVRVRLPDEATARTFLFGRCKEYNGQPVEPQECVNTTAYDPDSFLPGSFDESTQVPATDHSRAWEILIKQGLSMESRSSTGAETWVYDRSTGMLYGQVQAW